MFYDLVANIGTGETPVVTSPQKSIVGSVTLGQPCCLRAFVRISIKKNPGYSVIVTHSQPPSPPGSKVTGTAHPQHCPSSYYN